MNRLQDQKTRTRLNVRWIAGAALAAVTCIGLPAAAQAPDAPDTPEAPSGETSAEKTVVVTQRPLRTFRGDSVRVGHTTSADVSIGVVRPIRAESRLRRHNASRSYSFGERYGRRYVGPHDLHIGVVRPFREYDPVVRNAPVTVTNPLASERPAAPVGTAEAPAFDTLPVTVGPVFPQDTPAAPATPRVDSNDPWSLFNAGRYREARQRFGPAEAGDTPETRTGRALAAALSGDLAAGSEWLPDAPALPAGLVLSDAAGQRIELAAEFLYDDNPATQTKLRRLMRSADTAR